MKISGHGAYWATLIGDEEVPTKVHNATYEVDIEEDVREHRSAGCAGWTEGLPRFKRVRSASIRVAEDDINYPQALGFTEGAEVSFWLKRGALDQFDQIESAIVSTVRVVNDQQKARWVEIVCEHGRYVRDVESPFPPEEPEEPEEP